MTDDLTEIDGLGPAREEKLADAGYETYADLAEADPEVLTEEVDRLPEDSALEIVVQAQNLADLEEADVTEEPEVEEVEEEPEPPQEADFAEEEPEVEEAEDAEELYEVTIEVETGEEYDTLFHTVFEERATIERTNRAGADQYEELLEEIRATDPGGTVSFDMTSDELNDLHNAVLQQRISYQGDNLIDYMDALQEVENRINELREQFLF